MADAIVKLTVKYPRDYEKLIDENELRGYTSGTFEFHLVKRPQVEARVRLATDENIASLPPLDLLNKYWEADHVENPERAALQALAALVLETESNPPD